MMMNVMSNKFGFYVNIFPDNVSVKVSIKDHLKVVIPEVNQLEVGIVLDKIGKLEPVRGIESVVSKVDILDGFAATKSWG